MSTIVLLDTGPLSMVTHPRVKPKVAQWINALLNQSIVVLIPEIADYELRRELLRADKEKSVQRLDALEQHLGLVPITTPMMHCAAKMWAQARKNRQPTAHDHALDGDMILAAQASILAEDGDQVVVATTNVGHLSRFVPAKLWSDIAY